MGTTTAGLPLRTGEHYEKCPGCATVYRTKRRTRFRCPGCHGLAYAIPTPDGEPGRRRAMDGDPAGRVYRVLDERPAEGAPAEYGADVVVFLEDPDGPAPLGDVPSAPTRPGVPPGSPASDARISARRERDRGPAPTGRLARLWRGSLGDVFRRG